MPASIAASMIGTFRSYQELLITESHFFSSRTRDAASRASTETGTARSSRCAPAKASASAAVEGPDDRAESMDAVEGTRGAGPSASRGEAGDQCGAGDIERGPARAHSRVEGDDERESRDARESGETQQEEGSEKQGPSDGPV